MNPLSKKHEVKSQSILCRMTGERAHAIRELKQGTKVYIEGKLRYSPTKLAYVEIREIDL
jgi:hypothetical protein